MRSETGVITAACLSAKHSKRGASSQSCSLFCGNVVCRLILKYILGALNSIFVMWLIN